MAKKAVSKKTERPGEQYMLRMPDGMRAQVTQLAEANGRSLNAEIVAAIEKHIVQVDRINQLYEQWGEYKAFSAGVNTDIEKLQQEIADLKFRLRERGIP